MRHYQVEVTVLTNLFIGSGETFTKKEYAYDRRTLAVHIIDMKKMMEFLMKRNMLQQYERFLLNPKERDLMAWLKRMKLEFRLSEITAYTVDNDLPLERNLNEIHLFIKDAYGIPYVPGSSIKGMIRTSLIGAHYIQKNQGQEDLFSEEANHYIYELKRSSRSRRQILNALKNIDAEDRSAFRAKVPGERDSKNIDIVRDLSKYISVSDSNPIDLSQLTLSQKIDMTYREEERPLPILRETLKENSRFSFTLSIPDKIPFSNVDFPYTIESILDALHIKNQQDPDFAFDAPHWKSYKHLFRLGGGVGFQNKTFYVSKYGTRDGSAVTKEILKKLFPSNHKHDQNKVGQSPHLIKMTEVGEEIELMGLCTAKYKELQVP